MRSIAVPAAVLVVVGSAMAGGVLGQQVSSRQDRAQARYRVYTSALAAIEKEYVDKLDTQQVVFLQMLRAFEAAGIQFAPMARAIRQSALTEALLASGRATGAEVGDAGVGAHPSRG